MRTLLKLNATKSISRLNLVKHFRAEIKKCWIVILIDTVSDEKFIALDIGASNLIGRRKINLFFRNDVSMTNNIRVTTNNIHE